MDTKPQLDIKKLWESVLVEIELNVSKATFNTWFKDTFIIKEDDGVIYLGVPNEFVKTWLEEKYHKFILKALRSLSDHVRGIEYVVKQQEDESAPQKQESQPTNTNGDSNKLPLKDNNISKKDNLNPRYNFNSFVVGPFNELAYAAAQACIKKPGVVYNPLFVYGKTGYGKTHLIQAIGNHIKQTKEDPQVYYMTTEKFAIDFINSVQKNKVNQFKSKYRKYDVLIMDDIQFLSGKEKTQEELFHLFNTLHDNNKQIVFSSDMHPNYLNNFEDRLKSRFNAGMIVDISNPDKESRVAILKSKAKERDINVSDDIIECLASSIDSNIRELEGALNTVVVQSDLKEDELTVSEVKNLIRDNIKSQKAVPIDDIIQIIADFYNVDEESIHKKTRKRKIVKPRQIIMYVLREDYGIPYPTIGEKIGGRDHTTVIHSYEKIKDELNVDSQLAQEINQIRSML